ncbi:MAG: hypothetical protein M1830_010263, partial [Pleopsidium flavum]
MAELHQRLGNLQAQLTVKEDALNTEKRQTQRIRAERDDCRRQITELKHTVQQQNRTIKEQTHLIDDYEKKIEQQKRTIQVQSDTISGKQHASERGDRGDRVDRRLLMTPSHHRETQHTYQEDTPTAAPTARRVRISDQPPPPFPIRRSEPNDSRVPPNLRSQHSSNTQALVRYGDEAPPQPQQGLGSNLLALVPYDDTSSANTEYLAHLQYIFNLSEAWARNHANIPDASRDSRIPESVKATLETLSDLSLAPTLLRNANTRHFLVAKVINHCLAIEIFKIGIFKGFSNDTDHQLQLTKSRIFQNTPFAARKAMHHAIARTIIEMKMKSGFDAFQTAKADEHAGKLYAHLQHLVAPGTEQARRDL